MGYLLSNIDSIFYILYFCISIFYVLYSLYISFQLQWKDPDEEGLVDFLVKEKRFNEQRLRKNVIKLKTSLGAGMY